MIKRGLVLRIKDGLYHVIPYESDSSTYFPNWHLVGESMVRNRDQYLSNQIINLPGFKDVWRDLKKHWKRYSKFINA